MRSSIRGMSTQERGPIAPRRPEILTKIRDMSQNANAEKMRYYLGHSNATTPRRWYQGKQTVVTLPYAPEGLTIAVCLPCKITDGYLQYARLQVPARAPGGFKPAQADSCTESARADSVRPE